MFNVWIIPCHFIGHVPVQSSHSSSSCSLSSSGEVSSGERIWVGHQYWPGSCTKWRANRWRGSSRTRRRMATTTTSRRPTRRSARRSARRRSTRRSTRRSARRRPARRSARRRPARRRPARRRSTRRSATSTSRSSSWWWWRRRKGNYSRRVARARTSSDSSHWGHTIAESEDNLRGALLPLVALVRVWRLQIGRDIDDFVTRRYFNCEWNKSINVFNNLQSII